MSPIRRSPPPSEPPAAVADLYEEYSEVRERDAVANTTDPGSRRPDRAAAGVGSIEVETRAARIDRKLRVARILLSEMLPTDSRVRLLQIAIVRRDETLLDGIFGALSRGSGNSPITEFAGRIVRRRRFNSQVRVRGPEAHTAPDEPSREERHSTLLPPPRDDSEDSR
jgi:hypothetical protein